MSLKSCIIAKTHLYIQLWLIRFKCRRSAVLDLNGLTLQKSHVTSAHNCMKNRNLALLVALLTALPTVLPAAAPPKLERGKDFIETPALGSGLFLPNLFQSDMVLQRDKPIRVWGWAAAGETVSVSFAGQTQTANAAADKSWKVTFPAMPANTAPQEIIIKGKDKTLSLKNILPLIFRRAGLSHSAVIFWPESRPFLVMLESRLANVT